MWPFKPKEQPTEAPPEAGGWDSFFNATVSQLTPDLALSRSAEKAEKSFEESLQGHELDRLNQAHFHRRWFFWFSLIFALIVLCSSSGVMIHAQIFGTKLSDAFAVAFITGLSIEFVGLLVIIGKYLFAARKEVESEMLVAGERDRVVRRRSRND